MKVVILKADSRELEIKEVETTDTYEMLSNAVGGYIESVILCDAEGGRRIVLWVNEEGKLENLPPNFAVINNDMVLDVIAGDAIITAIDEEGATVGLNEEELKKVQDSFDLNATEGVVLGSRFINKLLVI